MHLSFQEGWTALIWASCNGHVECVKVLLANGAEVNMHNKVSAISVGDMFTLLKGALLEFCVCLVYWTTLVVPV